MVSLVIQLEDICHQIELLFNLTWNRKEEISTQILILSFRRPEFLILGSLTRFEESDPNANGRTKNFDWQSRLSVKLTVHSDG